MMLDTMATSASPFGPADSPHQPLPPRRAFTLPPRRASSMGVDQLTSKGATDEMEVLFSHNDTILVAFSPPLVNAQPRSSIRDRSGDATAVAGTLPWGSRTEKVLSAGLFQIYRAHGVSFLHAGNRRVVHTIFAKTQCWCVDGQTKIVLRIRDNNYYRIELPNQSDEDRKIADDFKLVLGTILLFEKTPCPFKRGFTVDLPPEPTTPVKYKPWKRPERLKPAEQEKSWEAESSDEYVTACSDSGNQDASEDSESDATDDTSATPRAAVPRAMAVPELLKTPTRPTNLAGSRSVTAPPQLNLQTTPSSRSSSPSNEPLSRYASSSMDSLASYHTAISPFPPSPPDSTTSSPLPPEMDEFIVARSRGREYHSPSATEARLVSSRDQSRGRSRDDEKKADRVPSVALASLHDDKDKVDQDEVISKLLEPIRIEGTRRRQASSHKRGLSPLPPSAALYDPSTPPRSSRHLTAAIVQRAYALMLSPPGDLINLIVSLARKILDGRLRKVVIGFGERGESIPGSWDTSDGEPAGEGEDDDEWEEDDYGVYLGGPDKNGLRHRDGSCSRETL